MPIIDSAAVRDVAAAHADQADNQRGLAAAVVAAATTAGFARHFVPTGWSGRAGTFTELVRATSVVGEGCGSAAWCAMLFAVNGRLAGYLPEEAQRDLWRESPDVRIAGALVPSGEASRMDGGWWLRGEWPTVSAVEHCDWTLFAAWVLGDEARECRMFLVPSGAYQVKDTWFTTGLRGTGSNTVVLGETFVPDARSFPYSAALGGVGGSRCHRVPFRMVNALLLAAPVLGIVRGGLLASRLRAGKEEVLARCSAELRAGELLLADVARLADETESPDAELVARCSLECAYAVEVLVGVAERLYRVGGTRAQATGSPLQRMWRDAHAAGSHVGVQLEAAASEYAKRRWEE